MKHPYADVLIAIANGEKLQYQVSSGDWIDTTAEAALSEIANANPQLGKFRVKPKTININGIEVPEPLREAPPHGTEVWFTELGDPNRFVFTGCLGDQNYLYAGLMHLTRRAALLHSKALRSFTDPRVIVEGPK